MKVTVNSKNFNPSDKLLATIDNKFARLDKYFSKDVEATVMCSEVKKGLCKMEATIKAAGMIFRAEESSNDIYFCMDKVLDKLSSQMSRLKTKLIKGHKEQKDIMFAEIPDAEESASGGIVRVKRFELEPMTADEAILQMELLQHSFFVFRDGETGKTCIVYKRQGEDNYGLLETE